MSRRILVVFLALLAAGALSRWLLATSIGDPGTDPAKPAGLEEHAGLSEAPELAGSPEADVPSAPPGPQFPVNLRYPAPTPGVATGLVDVNGRSVTVACDVCHSLLREPPPAASLGLTTLKDFHRGLVLNHGSLTCLSCHDREDSQAFRLADGTPVERWDIIELCSQCHGPQRKDFDHGAHGGMVGYWDLSRGPRTRNACTSCHAPHAPQMGQVRPTFKPRDRFLTRETEAIRHEEPEYVR